MDGDDGESVEIWKCFIFIIKQGFSPRPVFISYFSCWNTMIISILMWKCVRVCEHIMLTPPPPPPSHTRLQMLSTYHHTCDHTCPPLGQNKNINSGAKAKGCCCCYGYFRKQYSIGQYPGTFLMYVWVKHTQNHSANVLCNKHLNRAASRRNQTSHTPHSEKRRCQRTPSSLFPKLCLNLQGLKVQQQLLVFQGYVSYMQ